MQTHEFEQRPLPEIVEFQDENGARTGAGLRYGADIQPDFTWGEEDQKWADNPDRRRSNTVIIATESGNQYIVGRGLVINAKTSQAYTMRPGAEIPPVVFGEKWGVEGLFQTSPVGAVLVEYGGSGAAAKTLNQESPFTTANDVLEAKRQELESTGHFSN